MKEAQRLLDERRAARKQANDSFGFSDYAADIAKPGGPVDLLITDIDTSLPLLHENDLAHYIDALISAPGLIVPTQCSLSGGSRDPQALLRLGQHFNASCSFLWYKFDVASPAGGRP